MIEQDPQSTNPEVHLPAGGQLGGAPPAMLPAAAAPAVAVTPQEITVMRTQIDDVTRENNSLRQALATQCAQQNALVSDVLSQLAEYKQLLEQTQQQAQQQAQAAAAAQAAAVQAATAAAAAAATGSGTHLLNDSPQRRASHSQLTDRTLLNTGHVGGRPARPVPQPISVALIKTMQASDSPKELLRLTLHNIFTHERDCNNGKVAIGVLHRYFEGNCLLWVSEMLKIPGFFSSLDDASPADLERFTREFLEASGIEVRAEQTVALEKLLSVNQGIIQKHDETVTQFAQRFKQVARVACADNWDTIFTQKTLCTKFCDGINANLRAKCVVDEFGNDWDNLELLIRFALTEERRLHAQLKALPNSQGRALAIDGMDIDTASGGTGNPPRRSGGGPSRTPRDRQQQRPFAKQAGSGDSRKERILKHAPLSDHENPCAHAYMAWDAVVFPPDSRVVKDFNSKGGFYKALSELPYTLKDISLCPVFRYASKPYDAQSRTRDIAAAWWLCGKCKVARHPYDECTGRAEQADNSGKKRQGDSNQNSQNKRA